MTPSENIIKSLEGKELESILINSVDNYLELKVSEYGQPTDTIILDGVMELEYKPDFSDQGPWLIMDCNYESELLENIIDKLSLLWTKESPALKNWLDTEVHRLKMLSGDFELTVTFKKIKTGGGSVPK